MKFTAYPAWLSPRLSSDLQSWEKLEFNETRPILSEQLALGGRSKAYQRHLTSAEERRERRGGYLIVMQSQTEFALIGSQVVLHKIWVLGVNKCTIRPQSLAP